MMHNHLCLAGYIVDQPSPVPAREVTHNALQFTPENLYICDYAAVWKDCMYIRHALQGMRNEQQLR